MSKILDKIELPNGIKSLSYKELNDLSFDVRELIINTISKNGGHLASSLGVVELTIALLRKFDFTRDKLIWDVGHQCYAYKILTDRKDRFDTIRTYGGISGFPKINESIYDSFNTGHSSTSISAGLGMCVARDLNNENYKVISVIGDGSMTSGMAFEALQQLSNYKKNFIIILNDNEMSISEGTGGLNKALLGLRTSKRYTNIKYSLKQKLEKSNIGLFIKNILITFVNMMKQIVLSSGMLFETLNINYVGPIDGHNIEDIEKTIEKAMNINEPVLIHIKTKKGKGYKYAEENPTKFHGINPFSIDTGEVKNKSADLTYTKVFSNALVEVAHTNDKVVAITAAMKDGTGLTNFMYSFPDRFFDVGICEQHAVTFAGGLATSGIIPVVCIYSTFLQRAFDQVLHDVCLQNKHIVFAIDRAGIVGSDGETHHGAFDLSYLRLIPNMTVMAPKNDLELSQMLSYAINDIYGPIAIRYPRGVAYTELHEFNEPISYGKAEVLYEGSEIAIFAIGTMVSTSINIKNKLLKKNIKVTIVNARFAKPIDFEIIKKLSKNHKLLIVMEENVSVGGIGESIEKYVIENNIDIKVRTICLPDEFIVHGDISIIKRELDIDSDGIIGRIEDLIENI